MSSNKVISLCGDCFNCKYNEYMDINHECPNYTEVDLDDNHNHCGNWEDDYE